MTSQLHSFAIGQQEHQNSVRFVLEVMKPEFTVEYLAYYKGFMDYLTYPYIMFYGV
jgi:hypothetical protein